MAELIVIWDVDLHEMWVYMGATWQIQLNYLHSVVMPTVAVVTVLDFLLAQIISAVSCLTFQVHYVTLSKLLDACTPSQLTYDFGGTLPYDHELWLHNRLVSLHFFLS